MFIFLPLDIILNVNDFANDSYDLCQVIMLRAQEIRKRNVLQFNKRSTGTNKMICCPFQQLKHDLRRGQHLSALLVSF